MDKFTRVEKVPGRQFRKSKPESAKSEPESRTGEPRGAVQDEEREKQERMLRMFDLDPRYGPFIGIDRLDRWHRAEAFGLGPPQEVKALLESGEFDTEGRL